MPRSSSASRLDLVPAGAATLTGLLAGIDGQIVVTRNASATQTVTLPSLSASSSAANEFSGGGGGVILPPLASCNLTYYGGTVQKWVITS